MFLSLSTGFRAREGGDPGHAAGRATKAGPDRGPDQQIDRVLGQMVDAGAVSVVLEGGVPAAVYAVLKERLIARHDSLQVVALESPFPHSRASLAELASRERDESEAAIEAARATLGEAGDLGASFIVVRLGEVRGARGGWPALRRAFLRAELNEDNEDDVTRARLVAQRAASAPAHLDNARRALERLGREGERYGVTTLVRNPTRGIGLPLPQELDLLLDELRGAPLGTAFDAPAAHLSDRMGTSRLDDTTRAWKRSPLLLLADACGPVAGLVPGRGELDLSSLLPRFDPSAHAAFTPAAFLDENELRAGLKALAKLLP